MTLNDEAKTFLQYFEQNYHRTSYAVGLTLDTERKLRGTRDLALIMEHCPSWPSNRRESHDH